MARRYFVDDSDNTISGLTDIDEVEVPTGYSAVLESTIRAVDPPGADGRIRSGSTWDGSTYTAATPNGLLIPYDADTELGRKQIASTTLHEFLHATTAGVHLVRHEKPQIDVMRAEDFIAYAHHANYVVAHMDTINIGQFEAWVTQMMLGAADVTSIQTYFEHAHTLTEGEIPHEACAWVNPNDAVAVILKDARKDSTQGGNDDGIGSWFEFEETDITTVDLGNGAWIRRLPEA